jgi:hypothetical protein
MPATNLHAKIPPGFYLVDLDGYRSRAAARQSLQSAFAAGYLTEGEYERAQIIQHERRHYVALPDFNSMWWY